MTIYPEIETSPELQYNLKHRGYDKPHKDQESSSSLNIASLHLDCTTTAPALPLDHVLNAVELPGFLVKGTKNLARTIDVAKTTATRTAASTEDDPPQKHQDEKKKDESRNSRRKKKSLKASKGRLRKRKSFRKSKPAKSDETGPDKSKASRQAAARRRSSSTFAAAAAAAATAERSVWYNYEAKCKIVTTDELKKQSHETSSPVVLSSTSERVSKDRPAALDKSLNSSLQDLCSKTDNLTLTQIAAADPTTEEKKDAYTRTQRTLDTCTSSMSTDSGSSLGNMSSSNSSNGLFIPGITGKARCLQDSTDTLATCYDSSSSSLCWKSTEKSRTLSFDDQGDICSKLDNFDLLLDGPAPRSQHRKTRSSVSINIESDDVDSARTPSFFIPGITGTPRCLQD